MYNWKLLDKWCNFMKAFEYKIPDLKFLLIPACCSTLHEQIEGGMYYYPQILLLTAFLPLLCHCNCALSYYQFHPQILLNPLSLAVCFWPAFNIGSPLCLHFPAYPSHWNTFCVWCHPYTYSLRREYHTMGSREWIQPGLNSRFYPLLLWTMLERTLL